MISGVGVVVVVVTYASGVGSVEAQTKQRTGLMYGVPDTQ
jgi:hypothetical protein